MYRVKYIAPDGSIFWRTVYADDCNHAMRLADRYRRNKWQVVSVAPYNQGSYAA